jgi:4a-hydroxytetrahydrobiopterin dehydratase
VERRKLSDAEITERLATLPGWTLHAGKLRREFRFPDFSAAFGFMTRAALAAEQLDHHPDWRNVYNRVEVSLHTHDRGGVTEFDFELARRMNALAGAG